MNKPTEKQMKYIHDLHRFRAGVPEFKGTTKKEASEFIQKYKSNPMYRDEDVMYDLLPDAGFYC